MQILYVPKNEIFPAFGTWAPDHVIRIRADLSPAVTSFVLAHEIYHEADTEKRWWLRELKANLHAFCKFPFGGMVTLAMSLSPARLMYYVKRLREGE